MRIALIVDNPYRDLPGIVLLANRLCAQGATCYLVPTNLEWREIGALAPDFVLLTNLRRPRQEFARRLLDAGMRIGVLESEGGVIPNFETYDKMSSPDRDVFGQVSCFCTWGRQIAAYAMRQGWYEDRQVAVTGAPRFDFYAERWREAALRASPEIAGYAKPIILINGSFPRANPRFLTPEQEIESWARLGFSREFMVRFQAIELQALHLMAEVANHVAARFPHATVVYRPHPFEKLETYETLLDRRDNLRLLKVGTVEGWILRASAIIHRNSTTAIEASMAGRPALLPTWLPVAETLEACDAVSVKCDSFTELDGQLSDCLSGQRRIPDALGGAITRVIYDWFHAIDGLSHERVADAILPHLNGNGRPALNIRGCRNIHYLWHAPTLSERARVGIALRMGVGLPVTWSFSRWSHQDVGLAWDRSEKAFDVTRVRSITDALGEEAAHVSVGPAEERGDYRFGYRVGRSVAMRPAGARPRGRIGDRGSRISDGCGFSMGEGRSNR